ncbi:MAG: DUF2284 domain-containing protein [Oscillospiraceae bacterium]|nr:DUF2284 domain-containing protein [Oscillospiraceae bacterium]
MERWIALALEAGFTHAAPLDPAKLRVNEEVRAMCAANKCRAYDHNWTCPPNCGTLDECAAQIAGMRTGLLVQTTGTLEDSFDIDAMEETEERHLNQFHKLAGQIREAFPGALCLGSGGCRLCETCAHPEPCRFPDKACSSMEGYGLLVNDVCELAGLKYYYGKGTLTYSACYLLP